MKLIKAGELASGGDFVQTTIDAVIKTDTKDVEVETPCTFLIQKDTTKPRIFIKYEICFLPKGSVPLVFETKEAYYVEEIEIDPVIEELKPEIKNVFSKLKKEYTKWNEGYKIPHEIKDVSSEEVEETALNLSEVLLSLRERKEK